MIQGDYLYFAPLFLQKCYRLIFLTLILTLINFKKPRTYCTAWDRLALSIILETHSKMARKRQLLYGRDFSVKCPFVGVRRYCLTLYLTLHSPVRLLTYCSIREELASFIASETCP